MVDLLLARVGQQPVSALLLSFSLALKLKKNIVHLSAGRAASL